MFYEYKKETFIKYVIFLMLIIIIFLLWIMVMKIDYNSGMASGEYKVEKTVVENVVDISPKEEMIEICTKSIVGISKIKQMDSAIFAQDSETKLGLGSGVIISENGYILTNAHVVGSKFSTCFVTLENGRNYSANVIWADENIDLAIIKILAYGLNKMEIGDSDDIRLADDVYAIGNPIGFEFQRTVTKGIISGINRTIKIENEFENQYMEDLIQTDATINEGNSGGALIDSEGKLIGINTVKLSDVEGIGFAVPINIVKPIIEKLVKENKFEEAYLGLSGFDKEVIPYLNSSLDIDTGVYVAKVNIDGPLFTQNILEGDIILEIDGYKINKMNDLKKYVYSKNPGDIIKIKVKRGFGEHEIEVNLGKK